MNSFAVPALMAAGTILAARTNCFAQKSLGVGLIGLGLMTASPAMADQNVMVGDNGTVLCDVSLKDLSRISLRDDKFASVSKVQSGIQNDDFEVVNEPIRGDIYLSIPEGFKRSSISFFTTTQKGYVYKFLCQIHGDDAQQIFVANADSDESAKVAAVKLTDAMPPLEKAARLVKAMYEQGQVEGFDQNWHSLAPANVGGLRVQLVASYHSKALVGSVLKIDNRGDKTVDLNEEQVAPRAAIAVSIVNPKLGPKEATTAYVVELAPAGGAAK
jgi:conjugal transfer pilus assembly protein TraK